MTTSEERCVVHFYHTDFRRCSIMHTHLEVTSSFVTALILSSWRFSSDYRPNYGCASAEANILSDHSEEFYYLLAFTWPKAGREVGPLNWTQEHKCV